MVIRKLKLHEWFLKHQLEKIKQKSFHIPVIMKIDITALSAGYDQSGKKIPINALFMKALGLTALRFPQMHRMLFNSFFGLRFLESQEIRINFPIEIEHKGEKLTTAIVIKNPHLKTVEQIHSEIKESKLRPIDKYPITRFVYSKRNNLLNRTVLKTLYWLLSSSPKIYNKLGGGGLSFTSLTHIQNEKMVLTPVAYGPTGLTFCFNSIEKIDSKTYLHLGVGYDHYALAGIEVTRILESLSENLNSLLPAQPSRQVSLDN